MEIRTMTAQDYDELFALWSRTRGLGLNNLDDSCEAVKKFLSRNPSTCFVALSRGKIIGSIMCGSDGRRGYIYHTAVEESERGKGIGRALVDAVLQALEAEGINKAALVVFAGNSGGNQFWERCGFTARDDLIYRNRTIKEFTRIDT